MAGEPRFLIIRFWDNEVLENTVGVLRQVQEMANILLPIKDGVQLRESREGVVMTRKQWDSKTKAMIVMEGLKGKPVAEICEEYQIRQNMYYKWRDQLLGNIGRVFENVSQRERQLLRENSRLKRVVGELTLEIKKSDGEW